MAADRDGPQRHLGDEAERALAADDQVGEDLAGVVEVQQRVEAVAHGVLHRELLADLGHRRRVGPNPVPQPQQTGEESPARACAQSGVGVRGTGVHHRARRQHHHHRIHCAVGVLDGSARHAAGVVGDDTADRAGALARRVGADLAAVAGQLRVEPAHRDPGLGADAGAVVEHLRRAEFLADVDQDAVGHRLTRQAGAPGPQGERHAVTGADREQPTHLRGVAGGDDHLRGEQEVRGVVGGRVAIQRAGTHSGGIAGGLDEGVDQRRHVRAPSSSARSIADTPAR